MRADLEHRYDQISFDLFRNRKAFYCKNVTTHPRTFLQLSTFMCGCVSMCLVEYA